MWLIRYVKKSKPVDDNGKVNKNEQPVIEKVTVID